MKLFKPTTILVTGGAGFIGANFIRYYLQQHSDIKIINLDKLTYAANPENLADLEDKDRLILIRGDISDPELVLNLLRKYEINCIVNFAAESHVDRSINDPLLFAKSNVLGTANLVESARLYWLQELKLTTDQCRFYQISTDEVFGSLSLTDEPCREHHLYQPRSPYSASKAGADHFVHAYHHTYGLPIVLSHCSNNYGPFQHTEKFIPTIINACFNQQPIPIYGSGKNIRDWIYVEDHCRAIHAVLEQGKLGENYNIAGNNQVDNITLATEICQLLDTHFPRGESYSSLIQYVTDRLGHDLRYALNIDKITKDLNWQPKVNLKKGLMITINYYKKIWDKKTVCL